MTRRHRFARQLLLREIGSKGQDAIELQHFKEVQGRAGDIAALYLRGAGARVDAEGLTLIPLSPPANVAESRIALDTVRGALGALEALRRTVGLPAAPPLSLPQEGE